MTSPAQLLAAGKLTPRKQLGQNFLRDPSTAEMIVQRANLLPEDVVLEIGAGLGALTVPLARAARKVFAVEKDGGLAGLLAAVLAECDCSNVTLINQNILQVGIEELARLQDRRLVVVGNLPYNISSQILIHLIKARTAVNRCVLMFQKELAQRLMSAPGTRDFGRLTVVVQHCADIRRVAAVKAALFYPIPKVDSEVVAIDFRSSPSPAARNEALFFQTVKAAFSKRRKTLKNALAASELALGADLAGRILASAGIDPRRRAESLSVAEFVRLSDAMGAQLEIEKGLKD